MQDAQTAAQQGSKERARQKLREATQNYPASKEPWAKLAEDYFESADYGNAILAAQEVSQRDPQDRTSYSILAVSGLRVSSVALTALRAQQSGVPTDTRSEAQQLTKTLREALGEQVLVPRPDSAPAPAANKRRSTANATSSSKAAPGAVATPVNGGQASAQPLATGAASSASASAAAKPSAAAAASTPAKPANQTVSSNPFDKLR